LDFSGRRREALGTPALETGFGDRTCFLLKFGRIRVASAKRD
jgi:hypothetical protein